MLMQTKLLFLFLLLIQSTLAAQNRIYVHAAALGANNGSSWENAFTELQNALHTAQSGDEIWVAQGTYKPTSDLNRDSSFQLPSGARLIGGFVGSEAFLSERDWVANPCILSGDIGTPGDSLDNSYTILYLKNADSSTLIDGFVLESGTANASSGSMSSPQRSGAAIYVMGADGIGYADIRNCVFRRNAARISGGAVYINGGGTGSVAPQFYNCTFIGNRANVDGGAVYRGGSSWVEQTDFNQCIFDSNYAGRNGGALYFQDAERSDTFNVEHCSFLRNRAINEGGAFFSNNGRNTGSKFRIGFCVFKNNSAANSSAISIVNYNALYTKSIEISNCSVDSNKIENSSGIIVKIENFAFNNNSTIALSNISFSGNTQSSGLLSLDAFEIEFLSGQIQVSKVHARSTEMKHRFFISISSNTEYDKCDLTAPNIELLFTKTPSVSIKNSKIQSNNLSENKSSAISPTFASLNIKNCLFKDFSDLIYLQPNYFPIAALSNCIFIQIDSLSKYNTSDNFNHLTLQINHSYFDQNIVPCGQFPQIVCGPGNIFGGDPLFVDATNGDYRLLPCSPLVNAGDSGVVAPGETDLNGQPRIQGGGVDIGPNETKAPLLATEPVVLPACPDARNGAVAFTPENGCAPYQYQWANASESGQNLNQLAPGDYTFTITDARGAFFTVAVNIPFGSPLSLTPQSDPAVCGDTIGGTATVSVYNGLGPYQYAWSGIPQTDSLLSGLAPGTYALTVTDAQGCTAAGAVSVQRSGNLQATVEVQDISCPGASDGALTVLPANGKAPFEWQWENGPSSPAYGPLGPGQYRGTLTDAFGCSIQWILPLAGPAPLEVSATVTPATDTIQPNGVITLDAVTGGSGSFSALWSTGESGFQLNSLSPGTYTVTVTDAHNCTVSASYSLGFTVDTDEPRQTEDLRVFPNPASDWVTVVAPKGGTLILYDALGRHVRSYAITRAQERFFVRDLPEGVYFWRADVRAGRLVLRR
jgi:hypothetical protein